MILHLIFNSLLVFFLLSLLVELFLFSFKITNSRARYLCRTLPILKIPFDLFAFSLFGTSLFINLNPLSCEIFVQELFNSLLPSHMKVFSSPEKHLIIPQYIANQIPSFWLACMAFTVVAIALIGFSYKITQFINSKLHLKKIISRSVSCDRAISYKPLQEKLMSFGALILISSEIEVPFATGRQIILFPQRLAIELAQEEFEAVIAHELEHLCWRDPFIKLICSFICVICWWLPTKWWLKRLLADQEQASDASIHKYGINNMSLATAFSKTVNQVRNIKFENSGICLFDSSKSACVNRLKYILNLRPSSKSDYIISFFGAFLCLAAFMSFWMC